MGVSINLLSDDFTDGVESPMWGMSFVAGSATKAETGGQARFTLPSSTAGTHQAYYWSSATYDLTNAVCFITIGTMVATGVAASAVFDLYLSSGNALRWIQTSNTLKAQTIVGGVTTDLYSVTWNATTYKYLRIREGGGNVLFDSSSTGTAWTGRAAVAIPFTITDLSVRVGAECGNVASPGSFRLDEINIVLPVPSSTWRETTADWGYTDRRGTVTLASDGGKQGVLVTADTMDSSRVLGGTVRYFAGPLGSSSGGYLRLTEYTSLVLAQASAFPIPVNGRVDFPAAIGSRFTRLYHRSIDASAHTIYEFLPRRLVQADDIEAESIKAINISAGAVTADKISVLDLSAITATIGQLTIGSATGADAWLYAGTGTGDAPGTGLKLFEVGGIGKLSGYNGGVEQATFDTDGRIKAGAGAVVLDAGGVTFVGADVAASRLKWNDASAGGDFASIVGAYGSNATGLFLRNDGPDVGHPNAATITLLARNYLGSTRASAVLDGLNQCLRIDSGLYVGTSIAPSVAAGKIEATNGALLPRSSGSALFAADATATGTALSIVNNGTATPFGASRVFSGLMIISETAINGNAALFLIDGGGNVTLVGAAGATWSTTATTASKTNVYITGSAVTIENKLGSTASYNIMALRTRTA